jgi:uncharacterized repeat protein (TIGR01451 family)
MSPQIVKILNTVSFFFLFLSVGLRAQLPFTEGFTNSTAPGVVFGGNPNPAKLTSGDEDPVGDGFLRITDNTNNQAGFAYNDAVVLPSVGLSIEFEFFQYGGTGADGIVFFLFDATADPFEIGSYGGSLGYAQRFGNQPGLSKGYLGIGLDHFGNFSNPTEGRQGGPGRLTNSVTIRGSGNGVATVPTNYPYLTHTRTSVAPFNFNLNSGATRITDPTNAGYRKCYIRLKPRTGGGYFIDVDIETGGTPTTIHNVIVDYEHPENPPQELKFGFSAGTGGSTNFHEIRNFGVEAFDLASVPAPVALDDDVATCINESAEIDFISNDYAQGPALNFLNTGSIDLDPLTPGQQTTFTNVGEGTFTFNTTTQILAFTPDVGFTGSTSVDYTIKDAYGQTSNVATITLNVVNAAGCVDLEVVKTVNIGNPDNADGIVFTITASNNGPNDGTGVVVTDVIPNGYTYVSNNRGASYDGATQTLTWNIGDLDNGDSETMEVNVTYNSPAANHLNTAVIDGNEDDPNPNNDESSVRPLNLSITKTANTMAPAIGGQIVFTLEVTNHSLTVDAPIVRVTDVLPAGYTHISNNGGISVQVTGQSVEWNVGYLNANTSQTLEITCAVESTGPYENTASVRDISGLIIDTDPSDNESSIEPAPEARTPFACNNTGYLFLGTPNTQVSTINFATGVTSAASNLFGITGLINGLGYNVTDNYIWGAHNGNNTIVRIDSDYNVDEYTVVGLPNLNYVAGDVSPTGILHLYDPSVNYIVRVDVDPNSANYLNTSSNLTILNNATPISLNDLQDFGFNAINGSLYGIFNGSNSRRVVTINPTTGARIDRGTLQAPSGTTPNGPYEAVFTDSDGRTLFVNGGNGQVWGVSNVTLAGTLGLQAQNLFTSTSSAVGLADGAFCRNASFGQNWFDIDAQNDDAGTHTDDGADDVVNILPNDTKGSYTVTAAGVNITVISNPGNALSLDVNTGWISVRENPGSPGGSFTLTYQICEVGIPSNCDQADVTVNIIGTLPVTWLSFNGRTERGGNYLTWSTASEVNNDYFEIQRSIDGQSFEVIGYVQGNGTISTQSNYALIDDKPFNGYNYYRLRQVDFDGTDDFSRTIVINTTGEGFGSLKVFPNPTSGLVVIDRGDLEIGEIILKDAAGRVLRSERIIQKTARIDLSTFESGIYFLSDAFGSTVKIIKQ